MFKKIGLSSIFIIVISHFFGQNHVRWTYEYDYQSNEIVIIGNIDKNWHLYSTLTPKNAGPVPVNIMLNKSNSYRIKGKPKETLPAHKLYDRNFESTVFIFENIFESRIKVKPKKNRNVTFDGTITYMVCNDEMCLPPIDKKLSIKLNSDE